MSERHLRAVDGDAGTATNPDDVDHVLDAVDVVLDAAADLDADPDDDAGVDHDVPAIDSPSAVEGVIASDPLLDRAARIAELPLDERPGAFDSLNAALVAELNQLEDL